MPTATIWRDNNYTSYFTTSNGDTLTVVPGVYAIAGPTFDLITLANASELTNFGSLISSSSVGLNVVYVNAATSSDVVVIRNAGLIQRVADATLSSAAIGINEGSLRLYNSGKIEADHTAVRHNGGALASIFNTGLIYGHINGIYSDYTGSLSLTNDGTIVGGVVRGGFNPADTINNRAGGTISGAITFTGGGDTLLNAGAISGAVSLGEGANILTNSGAITGAVTAGAGVDTLNNSGSITGAVDLGAGNNVVISPGAIYGSLTTGAGVDTIDLSHGVITGKIIAGLGGDTIIGTDGRDVVYGDDEASTNTAGGDDNISVGGGNDLVYGGYGADTITGGYGDDLLNGGYGADVLYGNQGDDILYGNQDADWMHGGQGNDYLYGGQGNDQMNGGVGDDYLVGGLGNDLFVFAPGFGHDTVADFSATSGNVDVIQFQPGTFTDFADVMRHATQLPGGTLLTTNTGDTVFLAGVTAANLTAPQFGFG